MSVGRRRIAGSRRRAGLGSIATLLVSGLVACSSPEPPPPPPTTTTPARPLPPTPLFDNVVLVTLDTVRADHLGCYGYPRATSPFIDSLAATGVTFTQAVSASSHTAPSHATLFTSLYPEQHRVLVNGVPMAADIPNLAALLGDAGRETAAFASVRFLDGLTQGFDVRDAQVPAERRPPYRYAHETLDRALEWLSRRDQARPFLLWVHLYDAHEHGPHARTDPGFLEAMQRDSRRHTRELLAYVQQRQAYPGPEWHGNFDRYDAQIAFMDAQLARLHAALGAAGTPGRTLWVITADHGEGMGNHDHWSHGRFLYAEQLRVPLIFHASDGSLPATRLGQLVRLVDVLPTLAALTGVALPAGARVEGRSLIPLILGDGQGWQPEPAFAQRRPADDRRLEDGWSEGLVLAGQDARYKYILNSGGEDELYDLIADPHEQHNLLDERPEAAKRLREWLSQKYEALAGDHRAEGDGTIDESHLEELRALGYL